jgi:HD-like signal output (HDOD) protein
VKIALSDQKNIIDQLRAAGLAQQFLPRSFEMKSLQESIARAITLRDLLNQNMLQRIIPQVRSLPSLPNLYLQIADELNKPMPSPERVGQIISQDISMTAKVLQLVNSAHFGLPYQVANPTQATVLLGLEAIRDLVLVIKVFSNFDQLKLRHLGLTQLWNHSIAVGAYARQIARSLLKDKRAVEYSFVSGLLHDIGKLVLADNLPMKYHSAMEMAARQHLQLCDAEQETFGTTHAQVGAYLMWLWNLPDPVVVASAYHHAPSTHPEKTLTPMIAVHLANVFVHDASGGGNKRWLDPSLDRKCLAELSLLEQVEELQQSLVH